MLESMKGADTVCKSIYMNISTCLVTLVFLEDVTVTLIDKSDPSNPTKREDYWIYTLKTKAPMGLNIVDCLLD